MKFSIEIEEKEKGRITGFLIGKVEPNTAMFFLYAELEKLLPYVIKEAMEKYHKEAITKPTTH